MILKLESYTTRFGRLFDYIDNNLDDDLSLDVLSQVVNFSKYHFHRVFSAYCGISLGKYVQLMRLKQASYRLAFKDQDKIIEIALDSGFENPESFARAFKAIFAQTPTEFRKTPDWKLWNERYQFPNQQRIPKMEVNLVTFQTTPIAVAEHLGPAELVNDTARIFIDWRKASGLSPKETSRTFGIAYDNPDTTEPDKFRFDICGEIKGQVPPNDQGVIAKVIEGGRCAVVRHLGSHNKIGQVAYFLYRDWLPESGEELRDFPLFFHYLNLITDVPEHELITDVYLPIR